MSARDELAEVIRSAEEYGPDHDYILPTKAADAILAAGYRKPRTITTAEELDALPNGSVVLDAIAYAWQRMDSGNWVSWLNPGETSDWMARGKRGPFTLIHETASNESWLTAHQEGTR